MGKQTSRSPQRVSVLNREGMSDFVVASYVCAGEGERS